MLLEIADFRIHPGQQAEFGAAIAHGVATVLSTSPGFISARVERGIESPAARRTTARRSSSCAATSPARHWLTSGCDATPLAIWC